MLDEQRTRTLAEMLGVIEAPPVTACLTDVVDIGDAKSFGLAILDSREFRSYIVDGLRLGTVPGFAGLLRFFLEHALGKPPDRIEHTGANGGPIQQVTEVRRTIVHVDATQQQENDDAATVH